MKPIIIDTHKNGHASDCSCSLCGKKYKNFSFKNGYVCESCINYIKDSHPDICNDTDANSDDVKKGDSNNLK